MKNSTGLNRAIEYGNKKKENSNNKLDFLNGYNQALQDTKAFQMFDMLNEVRDSLEQYDGATISLKDIKKLIKEIENNAK